MPVIELFTHQIIRKAKITTNKQTKRLLGQDETHGTSPCNHTMTQNFSFERLILKFLKRSLEAIHWWQTSIRTNHICIFWSLSTLQKKTHTIWTLRSSIPLRHTQWWMYHLVYSPLLEAHGPFSRIETTQHLHKIASETASQAISQSIFLHEVTSTS